MKIPGLACIFAAAVNTSANAQELVDAGDVSAGERTAMLRHIVDTGNAPVDYLVAKFREHDVVLLGEIHHVRENCELVAAAIPVLYERAGVRCIASEFLRSRHDAAVREVVTADDYDAERVVELFRDGPWPTWGFREYMDIVRAVWAVNRGLPRDAPRLSLVGLDSEWSQYAMWFEIDDRADRFRVLLERERNMIDAVENGPLAADEKVLVHIGFAHSVTRHGQRLGTVLAREHGDRVFQVCLHHEIRRADGTSPISTLLEALHEEAGGQPIGFDIVGSPFARLHDPEAAYSRMMPRAGFEALAQGYVVLAPAARLRSVRWTPGFIDAALFERAEAVAARLGYVKKGECRTADELDAKLGERFGETRGRDRQSR